MTATVPVAAGTILTTTKPPLYDGSQEMGLLSANPRPSRSSRETLPQRPVALTSNYEEHYGNLGKNRVTFAKNLAQRFASAGSLLYSKYDPASL